MCFKEESPPFFFYLERDILNLGFEVVGEIAQSGFNKGGNFVNDSSLFISGKILKKE
jgi:hypothetical protein